MTNEQLLEAAAALERMESIPVSDNPLLVLRIAALRATILPIAKTVREIYTDLQKEHQKVVKGEYLFANGEAVWNDPFAYRAAREALDAAEVEVPLPERKPLNFKAFPKGYPWVPFYVRTIAAIGWLTGIEEEE